MSTVSVFTLFKLVFIITLVASQNIRPDVLSHPKWKLLDQGEDCGHSSSYRIIGGVNATLGQYPWAARIGYMVYPDLNNITVDFYDCGGSVISDRYVLTAAHCHPKKLSGIPEEYELEIVQVRLGEHDVTKDVDCQDGVCAPPPQDIDVEEYHCHTGYEKTKRQDDICLVRLAKPIKFNNFVKPICLPIYEKLQNEEFRGQTMEVAGWGTENITTDKHSDVLKSLKVPIVVLDICKMAYYGEVELTERQLCAGAVLGQDSCGGDSGGPLMTPLSMNGPPRYFLVGIVSFGPGECGTLSTPGVYTRVSGYLDWILDNMKA